MKPDREVDLLHSVRYRQRHVSTCLQESRSTIDARSTGKISGPFRVPYIEANRCADVTPSRANNRRFRKSVEQFQRTFKIMGIDWVRVVIEARHKLKPRCIHELVSSAAGSDSILAAQNANSGKSISNRLFAFGLVGINMDQHFVRLRLTVVNHSKRGKRLLNPFVGCDNGGDAGFHNECSLQRYSRRICASATAPAAFG